MQSWTERPWPRATSRFSPATPRIPWVLDGPWELHQMFGKTMWTPRPYELQSRFLHRKTKAPPALLYSAPNRTQNPAFPPGLPRRHKVPVATKRAMTQIAVTRDQIAVTRDQIAVAINQFPVARKLSIDTTLSPFAQPFQPSYFESPVSTLASPLVESPEPMDFSPQHDFSRSALPLPPSPTSSDEYFTPNGIPEMASTCWFGNKIAEAAGSMYPEATGSMYSEAVYPEPRRSIYGQLETLTDSVWTMSRSTSSASSAVESSLENDERSLEKKAFDEKRSFEGLSVNPSSAAVTNGGHNLENAKEQHEDDHEEAVIQQPVENVVMPRRNRGLRNPGITLGKIAADAWRRRQMRRVVITGVIG
ncbi:hypothetical protein C8J56DRAFT_1171991 [Mycena floridula]|nr:hypothetical protein C8J56DRAFT_1171991 [Mycena floridula]